MTSDPLRTEYEHNGHSQGTDAGAIAVKAIGSKGLVLLCPKCKSILNENKALGRMMRTLNGEVWYSCPDCEYDYKFDKEDVSNIKPPLEYQMPVKPLENSHLESSLSKQNCKSEKKQ